MTEILEKLKAERERVRLLSIENKVKTNNLDVLYSGQMAGLNFAIDLIKEIPEPEGKKKRKRK